MPHLRVKLGVVVVVASLAAALFTPAAPAVAAEAGHISGVVEDESGLPYPGTVVRLVDAAGAVVGRGTTDEMGRYGIDALQGTYRFETETGAGDLQTRIEGVEVGAVSPLDVVVADGVRREVRFDGTMTDTQGAPLAGATLKLENRTLSESASTDGAGHFDLTVPAGRYPLVVQLAGPGGAQLGLIQDFDLTRNRHEDFQIATAAVDVTVRNTSGQPVPNIGVGLAGGRGPNAENSEAVLHGATTGSNFFAWVTSDGAGRAHLTGVVGATASVSAWSATAQGNQPGISLGQSNAVDLTVVAVSASPPDVGGQYRVQDVASVTTPDGYVHTDWQPPVYRASDGTDTLKIEWTTGDTEWGDEGEEHRLSVVDFRVDQAPNPLHLRFPSEPFTVRVLDPNGKPVAGAMVTADSTATPDDPGGELFPGGPVSGHIYSRHFTGPDGSTVVPMLPGHPPTLNVDPPSDRGMPADLTPTRGSSSAEIQLPGGLTVAGILRTPDGGRGGFYHATLVSTDGQVRRPLTFAADGVSYKVIVPPGAYQLVTDTWDNEPGGESDDHSSTDLVSTPFKITGDRTLDITFPALGDGTVSFVDPTGRPYEGSFDVWADSGTDAIELTRGIRATGRTTFLLFGTAASQSVSLFGPSTITVNFEPDYAGDTRIVLSGVPLKPRGRIVVAAAAGSDLAPPDGPTGMTAEQSGPGTIALRWNPPLETRGATVTGYEIRAEADGEGRNAVVRTDGTSAEITGLTPSTSYRVWVYALTQRGSSPDVAFAYISLDSRQPPAPPTTTGEPSGGTSSDTPDQTSALPPGSAPTDRTTTGYWALAADGQVYNFGAAPALGNTTTGAVDLDPTPTGKGYWTLNRNGQVQAFGDAADLGDVNMGKLAKGESPASLSATPAGNGYWVFTNKGRAIAFGDAPFLGDVSDVKLNGPVLGSVATPTGKGYYMVASDGGIFSFGDATFLGSMGSKKLNAPVQSLVPDADGNGYWLVASDGGIFAFAAPFRGSLGGTTLNKPVVGMVRYGDGYLMVGADGGIFNFSTLPFSGSLGDKPPPTPVVALAVP